MDMEGGDTGKLQAGLPTVDPLIPLMVLLPTGR
jgi:hypothetical protein